MLNLYKINGIKLILVILFRHGVTEVDRHRFFAKQFININGGKDKN